MAINPSSDIVGSSSIPIRPPQTSVAFRCLRIPCVVDMIVNYVDGGSLLYFSRTCRDLWNLLRRWSDAWRRTLPDHEHFAPFPGAHLRTPRTLAILLFTSECLMCGHETSNEIVGKLAVRLCNDCSAQHLVETWTYAGWQNGPYPIPDLVFLPDSGLVLPAPDMVLAYPEGTKSRDPTEFHFDQRYERSGDPESEVMIATGVEIAEYYSYDYVNPNYLNSAAIDQGCGFPTDLHEEDPVEFTSIQYSTNEPNKNHGPYFIFD